MKCNTDAFLICPLLFCFFRAQWFESSPFQRDCACLSSGAGWKGTVMMIQSSQWTVKILWSYRRRKWALEAFVWTVVCVSRFSFTFLTCVCLCHQRYVNISSLSFSPDAQFLCASSNTETVHIFKLEQHSPRYWKYSLLSLRLIDNWTNESDRLLSLTSLNFVSVCVCVSLTVGRRKLPLGQHM